MVSFVVTIGSVDSSSVQNSMSKEVESLKISKACKSVELLQGKKAKMSKRTGREAWCFCLN
jgi:hypothetical protein